MGVEFTPDPTYSYAIEATGGVMSLPSAIGYEYYVLIVAWVQWEGNNATLNAPAGWTVINNPASVLGAVSIFVKAYDGSASVTFTFSLDDVCWNAFATAVRGLKSSSPFSTVSTLSTTGIAHTLTALTTSDFPGSAFLGGITSQSNNRAFDLAAGVPLYEEDGAMNIAFFPTPHVFGGPNSLNVAYFLASDDGQSGIITWSSHSAINPQPGVPAESLAAGFWIHPSQAPSAPDVTAPTTAQQFTVGRDVRPTWNPASDPNIAAASLTYDLEYTLNGTTWTTLASVGAGVLFYDWDTTGITPSGSVQVRVRADNGTDAGPWGVSDVFALLADVAPGAPQNVQPSGIWNRQADLDITWVFNDTGDVQTAYEVEYSANADMSSSTSTGWVSSAVGLKNFPATTGILTAAGTRYYRVRTKDNAGNAGAWSQIKTLIVTEPISAPVITYPTAGDPPDTGLVVATFTGTGHVKIRYRLYLGATLVDGAEIATSGNSFTIGVILANDTEYTLELERAASDGLWSAEDSETFTTDYVGPAAPTVTITPIDEQGLLQITVTNSDTIAHQYIYIDGEQLDTPPLPADVVFLYAGARSGEEIEVIVTAYAPTTFGYTDSAPVTATQTLAGLFVHKPTNQSTTSNFAGAIIQLDAQTNEPEIVTNTEIVKYRGGADLGESGRVVAHVGRHRYRILNYQVTMPTGLISRVNQLETWVRAGATLCARDNLGEKAFGKVTRLDVVDLVEGVETPLQLTETSFEEVAA